MQSTTWATIWIQTELINSSYNHFTGQFFMKSIECESIECNSFMLGIFIDVSCAFDTVSHEILCNHWIIWGIGLEWIMNYVSKRKQYVIYKYNTCLLASILDGGGKGFFYKESCIFMMAKIMPIKIGLMIEWLFVCWTHVIPTQHSLTTSSFWYICMYLVMSMFMSSTQLNDVITS